MAALISGLLGHWPRPLPGMGLMGVQPVGIRAARRPPASRKSRPEFVCGHARGTNASAWSRGRAEMSRRNVLSGQGVRCFANARPLGSGIVGVCAGFRQSGPSGVKPGDFSNRRPKSRPTEGQNGFVNGHENQTMSRSSRPSGGGHHLVHGKGRPDAGHSRTSQSCMVGRKNR